MNGHGVINENDLYAKLGKAKQILNMVEGKSSVVQEREDDDMDDDEYFNQPQQSYDNSNYVRSTEPNPMLNEDRVSRINNSKLPDEIKKLMIEKPIEQINLGDGLKLNAGLNEDIIKGARRLMGNDKPKPTQQKQRSNQPPKQSSRMDENMIDIIEHVVRKVFDEKILEMKNNNDFSMIDEQLAIKVGNSVFKGKITAVKGTK